MYGVLFRYLKITSCDIYFPGLWLYMHSKLFLCPRPPMLVLPFITLNRKPQTVARNWLQRYVERKPDLSGSEPWGGTAPHFSCLAPPGSVHLPLKLKFLTCSRGPSSPLTFSNCGPTVRLPPPLTPRYYSSIILVDLLEINHFMEKLRGTELSTVR